MPRSPAISSRPRSAHPLINPLGVIHDFRDCAVEPEKPVWQAEAVQRVGQVAEAAHQIWTTPPNDNIERHRAARCKMLSQGIPHAPECLQYVGVVRLAADDEEHIRLRQEVLVADRSHRLHLLVWRIATEVRGNYRGIPKHFSYKAVCTSTEGWCQDGAIFH